MGAGAGQEEGAGGCTHSGQSRSSAPLPPVEARGQRQGWCMERKTTLICQARGSGAPVGLERPGWDSSCGESQGSHVLGARLPQTPTS